MAVAAEFEIVDADFEIVDVDFEVVEEILEILNNFQKNFQICKKMLKIFFILRIIFLTFYNSYREDPF